MGMLDQEPAGSEETASGGEEGAAEGEESQQGGEQVQQAQEQVERVALPAKTRRGNERARLENEVKSLKETSIKSIEELKGALARRDQELAELRGGMQAIRPILERGTQPQPPATQLDPADLRRQAKKALDQGGGGFDEYERLNQQANQVEMDRRIEELKKQLAPQQAQPQIHPALQAIQAQNWKVQTHPLGQMTAIQKDALLAHAGEPAGPERWSKAYKMAETELFGSSQQGGYSQQGAGALSGVPTGRNGASQSGGNRAPSVELTDHERMIAAKAGMKTEEYAQILADAYPERVVR